MGLRGECGTLDITRNDTAWTKETPQGRYLVVNSMTRAPVYFLAEIFAESGGTWQPLVCAPIDDRKVLAVEQVFAEAESAVEVSLPGDLPAPRGRAPGESWVQYRNQRIGSWGPGFTWWQRLHYRVTGRSRMVEQLRSRSGKPAAEK